MNFLEYSNRNHVNIIPKEDFQNLILEVFNTVATNLSKSLGPLGSNTLLMGGLLTSSSKDGFSIFKNLRFHNRYKDMIYNLIKAPCTRLNNIVGDGTTTAVVLTNCLFQLYQDREVHRSDDSGHKTTDSIPGKKHKMEMYYRLPRTFTKAWDEMIDRIVQKVQTYATPLDPEDYDTIYNLCYVTSNGNEDISKNIAETYKNSKSPVIKLKDSPTNKSYILPIVGFEFPANLIDEGYVRNEDLSVEEKNIHVMIFDHKIEATIMNDFIIPVNEILKSRNTKLLVLAPYYDAHMANTTLKTYMNMEYQKHRSLNLLLAQYAIGKLDDHQLADLAIVLRATVINQEIAHDILEVERFQDLPDGEKYEFVVESVNEPTDRYYRIIGTVSNALLSCTNGSIFRVKDIDSDERYQDKLRVAEKELADTVGRMEEEKQSFAFEISKARARVSQLKMENYIYYVGADSVLQKDILKDAVDDVVKCVRSAVRSGIVPGCQLSIMRACNDLLTELVPTDEISYDDVQDDIKLKILILELIQDACVNVYVSLLHGPEYRGMIKLVPMWQHVKDEGLNDLLKEATKKCTEIIRESIIKNQVFDLETLEFNSNIITSTETDVNVLLASSELIKLLISGNQCVFLDAEVNNVHDETVETYV